MSIIVSFSARKGGNCDQIAEYIAGRTALDEEQAVFKEEQATLGEGQVVLEKDQTVPEGNKIVYMREVSVQPCADCAYECMNGMPCIYRQDGIYGLLRELSAADKVFFVVPMYCGCPSALYFILNERCQDFFMQPANQEASFYDRLYVIGVYGSQEATPDFLKLFADQYGFADAGRHILGLERHKYGSKMKDFLLTEREVQEKLDAFVRDCSIPE